MIDSAVAGDGLIVFLSGAGISAESGIPTFRGQEGYWTVGSTVYQPQQMATHAAFRHMPDTVWHWYLYRRGVCRRARPNAAHAALAALESALGERFRLVTQNVDGLHLRAGNSVRHTYQIHGNIDFLRCADDCSAELRPIPEDIQLLDKTDTLSADTLERLVCHRCKARARPHVLWFDECYDEVLYRSESSLRAAVEASLLVTIGTSGSTSLPYHLVNLATRAGAAFIDINPARNPFADAALSHVPGRWIESSACESLPQICDYIAGRA